MEFTYDPALVAVSIAIAILGSFTGLVMTSGIQRIHGPEAFLRIILAGIAVGGGIWAMHFVAMLAVILPIPLGYNVAQTATSALIAMIFTAIAFSIMSRKTPGAYTLPAGAVLLGAAIGAMHYLGMYAVRGACRLEFSWLGVAISLIIAVQASAIALWFAFRERGLLDSLLGAVALALAVASMHYSAMEATRFLPAETTGEALQNVLSHQVLALAVSITVYILCGSCIVIFALLTFARRAKLRRQRVPAE
jgi:NO-binding membrane sensor protein with MHYT domain